MDTMLPTTKQAGYNLFFKKALAIFLFIFAILSGSLWAQDRQIIYNTPGTFTWTPPCGVTNIRVFVWGAGGAGGGANSGNTRGGGGGSGAFIWHYQIPVTYNTSYSIVVGAGGTGVVAANGGNGGNSLFRITSGTIFLESGGGFGGLLNGTKGDRGNVITSYTGSWGTPGGNGADAGSDYSGGGGASGSPITNGSVNASGSAGAIAPIGAYLNTNGGNGGNGRIDNGNGANGSMPGGGGGGAFFGASTNHSGGNGGNGQVIIEYNGVPNGYCSKNYTLVYPITNVSFNTINNTTTNAIGGPAHEKFCLSTSLTKGSSYTISVKGRTFSWPFNTDAYRVYFDWNQDGDFLDANEAYNIGHITSSSGVDADVATASITVPNNASVLLGKTLMRVVKNVGDFTDACTSSVVGQAEDYEVQVNGPCQQPTGATANGISGSITVCTGTEVVLRQTGGALSSGQNWQWTKTNCTGSVENNNSNSDAAFSVNTSGAGSTTYFVKAVGTPCSSSGPCQSITVNVIAPGTISANPGYSTDFSACRNNANASMASFAVGGGATSVTATGLPTGIAGSLTGTPGNYTYTLGGTATAAVGTYNYTLTLNPQTPCAVTSISGTITITDKPTISYSGSPFTFCQNAAITPAVPTVNDGGLTTTYAVMGTLPAGLTLNTTTGIISGTPTALSGATNYTIRATNDCGYTDVVINISVILGNTVFDIIPNGSQTHCSTTPGIPISLSGSVLGINYQLYRDGSPEGAAVAGTGAALPMGTHTTAGTYTIVANTGCATNMNGSFTLNITQAANATFSYGASVFCKTGANPIPTISGNTLTGGYFISSGGSLVFADASTGEINLAASNVGTFTINYYVPAQGGCIDYTSPPVNIQIVNGPNTYQIAGGGEFCSGGSGLPVTLNGSQSGATYQLFRDGSPVASLPGTGAAISFGNQTTAGTYTIQAALSTCTKWMDGSVDISIKPSPAPIAITPSSATLCQNTVIPLSVSGVPPGTSSEQLYSINSGNINLTIPDNNPLGVSSLLLVTGVPAGATITRINVNFNISHSYDGDLILNLKGPNSNVLNIANRIGGSGNHFVNTIVASNGATNISSGSATFTNTYLPHAVGSVQGATTLTGNISNTTTFNGLYTGESFGLNGPWFFTARDAAGGDVGTLQNWTINIYYTTVSNPVSVTWSPTSQVFMDAAGTVPYDNSSQARIYAKPSTIGTVPITATYTSGNGCAVSATTNLTVEQSPIITMTADYCSTPGKVKITATSDLPVTDWQWSDGFGTGIGSGNFVRYIEPNSAGTYYVTAKSTAGNNCPVSASMSVAQELVVNGDFEAGNTGFTSGYTYKSDFYIPGNPTTGLWPEATYTVDYNPQKYHSYFWGTDHTTANGSGKMMMVNGYTGPLIWSQTVTVLPNTNYYFSAYAVSLNDVGPFANLQFRINGAAIPPPAETGVLPSKDPNNEPGTWVKFYGQWNSGSNTTAQIEIIDLVSSLGGNDFALDDISFGTLSSFLNLTSAVNTDNQQACVGVPITQITYEIGGDGSSPVVTGLPAGLTTYWNGRDLRISGSPTASGTFSYNIQQQVCAGAFLNKGGTLTVLPASDAGSFDAPALSACYNSSGSIAVTGNVGSLTWQTSTDGISWTNKTPNNGNYTAATSALYYRVIAQNTAVCAKDTSVGVKLGIKNLWTGKTNDNWFTATNWSDDLVPTASATPCPDVIIPDMQGTGKPYPIIATSSAPINNLIIHSRVSPGVSLTILNNSTLQIAGSITAPAASINANDGTIEMNGSGSQNLAGSRFVGKNIEHLIVAGGTLNITSEAAPDTLNILEKLSFGNSNSHLNTGDRITLKSTAARTASVGVLNTGNVIGGRFTIERFIQHYLNWNMLTIPVRENISVRSSWQENGSPLTSTGFGTRITGPATPTPTGFDGTSSGYSAKWWDNTLNSGAGNWAPVINTTSESVNRRQGFFLFVRGDRGIGPGTPGNTTTLRGSGTIFDANNLPSYAITAPVNTSVSLANPYASAIGFNKLRAANSGKIEANFWVWDPTLWGNYGVGGYQTITAITGYKPTPGGSSIYSSGGSYPNIQSGQAIFVQTTTTNPTINFAESFKEDGSLQVARGSQSQSMDNIDPDQVVMLSTHLYAADGRIMDGNRVVFDDNYSDEVDDIDAEKYNNSYINFGLFRHNKALAVEAKSSLKATDTLFYKMSGLPTGNFRIGVSVQNIAAPHLQAELIDNYLHSRTPVSLTDSTWINFATTADAASKAANRFMMVFRSTGVVLPVTFVQVAAQRNADRSIDVQWQVANEVNILRYEVERSADGQQFAGILTREAANYSTYRQTDLSPLAMDNFYRIKAIGLNGELLYSAIVKVAPDKSPALITVSPNPVKDKQLQVRFTQYAPGNYTILLSNALGQEIYRRGITVQGSSFVKTIALQSTLAGGHYRLSVYDAEGNRLHSEALMVE